MIHMLSIRKLLVVSLLASACSQGGTTPKPNKIIMLFADGAGIEQWTLAHFADENLAVRQMPVTGLVDTRGSNHQVSGSAPTATAFATGTRSVMGAIGVGPDSIPRESVLEKAHLQGWGTGLITTTTITDATPAAFAAHVPSRTQRMDILQQMVNLPVNVLLGGGSRMIEVLEEQGLKELQTLIADRYRYVDSSTELSILSQDSTTSHILGLFSPGEMPMSLRGRSPSLAEMTTAGIDILDRNPNGFFLLVENEGSDTYSHRNLDREVLVAEMLEFDDAVGIALSYFREHPETLIVVTSDHETGGITLRGDEERDIVMEYATTSHTAALVPLFAIGPGSAQLGGLKRNDEIGKILIGLLNPSSN
ncbi:MAG: hypothetical protein CME30_04210 [Gemmatimonadetes bacterium]|nr:hypothetical protein [Gemmatimonadota bacterium]